MGVYMYAMHRTAKTVPVKGINLEFKSIVESTNHGKPSYGPFYDKYSPRTMAAIEKNAEKFRENPPDGFVFGKFCDGTPVYEFESSAVRDCGTFKKIGTLVKSGRSFQFVGESK